MAVADRVRWDHIYRQWWDKRYPAPDPLLLQYTPPLVASGRALDFCAGFGQNGLWLAAQGYAVDVMDISRVALQRAQEEVNLRGLRNVNLLQVDVEITELPTEQYDVVAVFRYLKRELFPMLQHTVKSGGRILYETYNVRYLASVPNFNPQFLLDLDELRATFATWDILYYDEPEDIARLVAVKR
jgi:SAM-dependent methyltransferase